jgi:hypothetical protein
MKTIGVSRIKQISRSMLPMLGLAPVITFAYLAGAYYIKDITGGGGLENTTSADEPAIQQTATSLLIAQKGLGFFSLQPWKQYKIVFANGKYSFCQAVAFSSLRCALLPGTYTPPNDSNLSSSYAQAYYCQLTATYNGGSWQNWIITVNGEEVRGRDWEDNGYSINHYC